MEFKRLLKGLKDDNDYRFILQDYSMALQWKEQRAKTRKAKAARQKKILKKWQSWLIDNKNYF